MLIALAIAFVLVLTVEWWVLPRIRRAREYIKNVSTCGYLAPPPTVRGVRWLKICARVFAFIQVGKVRVRGRENLDSVPGPCLVAPNHPGSADIAVLPIALNRPARYMAAQGVMRAAGGLGALITGPMGAFCVDLTPGQGKAAEEAAVSVLVSEQTLVMFPEGWAWVDGRTGAFKKGAVRIVKAASQQLQREAWIVPTFLRYGQYPGSWIRKLPPQLEYLWLLVYAWYYRRGCTIVFGEPIAASSLPEDHAEATEFLRQKVLALDPLHRNGEP